MNEFILFNLSKNDKQYNKMSRRCTKNKIKLNTFQRLALLQFILLGFCVIQSDLHTPWNTHDHIAMSLQHDVWICSYMNIL